VSLAIFDLDNTLIAGDSDHAWGQFLIEQGRVDADAYKQANDQFYQDYCAGTLDIQAYLRFALAPLKKLDRDELRRLHAQFMTDKIAAMSLSKAKTLIDQHKQKGDVLLCRRSRPDACRGRKNTRLDYSFSALAFLIKEMTMPAFQLFNTGKRRLQLALVVATASAVFIGGCSEKTPEPDSQQAQAPTHARTSEFLNTPTPENLKIAQDQLIEVKNRTAGLSALSYLVRSAPSIFRESASQLFKIQAHPIQPGYLDRFGPYKNNY